MTWMIFLPCLFKCEISNRNELWDSLWQSCRHFSLLWNMPSGLGLILPKRVERKFFLLSHIPLRITWNRVSHHLLPSHPLSFSYFFPLTQSFLDILGSPIYKFNCLLKFICNPQIGTPGAFGHSQKWGGSERGKWVGRWTRPGSSTGGCPPSPWSPHANLSSLSTGCLSFTFSCF